MLNIVREEYDHLWDQFLAGSVIAFEKIFDTYSPELIKYGSKLTTDDGVVEDAVQELFCELWEKRSKISRTTSISYYLLTSVRRKIVRNLQKSRKFIAAYQMQDTCFTLEPEFDNSTDFIFNHLQDSIQNLSNHQREIIYLRYYSNLSFDEISRLMELPKKSAYNLIFIALQNIKKSLVSKGNIVSELASGILGALAPTLLCC
ncbi:MAG: sigma-70 family RNA polymerase sigma factor [Cyclobacteriaceae bacterium]|nr:sigma-70 family RNA polymerase sigma factor [Cyclobacteriaceae bacterium]